MENLEIEAVNTNNIIYYSKKAPSQREFRTKVQINKLITTNLPYTSAKWNN